MRIIYPDSVVVSAKNIRFVFYPHIFPFVIALMLRPRLKPGIRRAESRLRELADSRSAVFLLSFIFPYSIGRMAVPFPEMPPCSERSARRFC